MLWLSLVGLTPRSGSFLCRVFMFSLCLLWGLHLPSTVQKHECEANWEFAAGVGVNVFMSKMDGWIFLWVCTRQHPDLQYAACKLKEHLNLQFPNPGKGKTFCSISDWVLVSSQHKTQPGPAEPRL